MGGLIPRLVDGGVSVSQYADDTIIFLEHGIEKAKNMNFILGLFSSYRVLRLTSTRANSSSLEGPKGKRISISKFLVASLSLY